MLPVGWFLSPWVISAATLAVLVVLTIRAFFRDRREYALFKRLNTTTRRQWMLRKWLIESMLWIGGSALLLLILSFSFVPGMIAEVESWPAMKWFRHSVVEGGGFAKGAIIGGAIALLVGIVASALFVKPNTKVPTIGDIEALLPRTRGEIKYGVGLSINAGIVEELLFRLALPTSLFAVTQSALVAIIASVLIFGLMHAYQGLVGIIGTTIFGAIMMLVFLTTSSIFWPILVHALFDLRSLVLIPIAAFRVHEKSE